MQTAVGVHLFFFCCKGSSAFFLFCKKIVFCTSKQAKVGFFERDIGSQKRFFRYTSFKFMEFPRFPEGNKAFF